MQVQVQSKYIIDKIFLFMNKVIELFHDIIHLSFYSTSNKKFRLLPDQTNYKH